MSKMGCEHPMRHREGGGGSFSCKLCEKSFMILDQLPMQEKPGRHMDAVVAERIMNWKREKDLETGAITVVRPKGFGSIGNRMEVDKKLQPLEQYVAAELPKYSTDIAAAWWVLLNVTCSMVVEMRGSSEHFKLRIWLEHPAQPDKWTDWKHVNGIDDAPEAICFAALEASNLIEKINGRCK